MENKNIIWQKGKIDKSMREKLLKQKGLVVWFTGLSGSGKSTIAINLEHKLYSNGFITYILDGDNIRYGINSDLGFNKQDRDENIRRVSHVAALMCDIGIITLVSFISPYRKAREFARNLIEKGRFIEVYVKADIDICKKRDPKQLYKKAINGEIDNFTGINAPYEEPLNPEIIIDTEHLSITESCNIVYNYIVKLQKNKESI